MWRTCNQNLPSGFAQKKFLLCVSGGADSLALFQVMKDLPIKIQVFHAHHGPGENFHFRNQACQFVQEICRKEKITFHSIRSSVEMKSENEFRNFRRNFLKEWMIKNPDSVIVMAHHFQDLLETRLMRLIRGTGPAGLQSMKIWNAPVFRPFLETDSSILKIFLNENKMKWCEDPSNKNTKYFRNWIRHRWLPLLEKARPGSLHRMAESLDQISTLKTKNSIIQNSIKRSDYTTLNQKDQLQHLALLLKSQGLSQFTSGQLKEVQKRLDNVQGRLTFKLAGATWSVNAQRILVKPL